MAIQVFFCSFADSRLTPSLNRICNEAEEMGIFDGVFKYNEFDLGRNFKSRYRKFLRYNVKGYGYWVWKPYVIQKSLTKLNEGDILLYADAGCCLNKKGKERWAYYIDLVKRSPNGIVAVSLESNLLERSYTKGDVLDYFNVRNNNQIMDTPQVQAGVILIQKKQNSEKVINNWNSAIVDDFNLINDSGSVSPNHFDFIAHRHDQSIFSILFKLSGGLTIPLNEVYVKDHGNLKDLESFPIWYIRNKNSKKKGIVYIFFQWIRSLLYDKNFHNSSSI